MKWIPFLQDLESTCVVLCCMVNMKQLENAPSRSLLPYTVSWGGAGEEYLSGSNSVSSSSAPFWVMRASPFLQSLHQCS